MQYLLTIIDTPISPQPQPLTLPHQHYTHTPKHSPTQHSKNQILPLKHYIFLIIFTYKIIYSTPIIWYNYIELRIGILPFTNLNKYTQNKTKLIIVIKSDIIATLPRWLCHIYKGGYLKTVNHPLLMYQTTLPFNGYIISITPFMRYSLNKIYDIHPILTH